MVQIADASCCLTGLATKDKPRCIIYEQRNEIMSKASWLRGNEMDGMSCAGRSLLEMLEDELDDVMDFLMLKPGDELYPQKEEYTDEMLNRAKGRAEGITFSIAIIKGPYAPNLEAVKGQAVSRYQSRQAAREVEDITAQ